MKPGRVILSTFFIMIVIQTVGSVDSQNRLPAPRQFVAISVLWGLLFLMAETTLNRVAARLSVLIVLTGMVIGPFGRVAIAFLNKVTEEFAIDPKMGLPAWLPGASVQPATDDTEDTDIA